MPSPSGSTRRPTSRSAKLARASTSVCVASSSVGPGQRVRTLSPADVRTIAIRPGPRRTCAPARRRRPSPCTSARPPASPARSRARSSWGSRQSLPRAALHGGPRPAWSRAKGCRLPPPAHGEDLHLAGVGLQLQRGAAAHAARVEHLTGRRVQARELAHDRAAQRLQPVGEQQAGEPSRRPLSNGS